MPQDIGLFANTPLSLSSLLLNLAVGALLALVLRWHFRRFGSTLSNRGEFDQVFPFVLLTTVLIITVVKSSLALSLGLVGALSIVRFRTPIKEPEELIYLFLAIALGLGYGAGHIQLTTILATLTLLMVFFWLSNRKVTVGGEYNLILAWPDSDVSMGAISESMSNLVGSLKLIRFETGTSGNTAVLLVEASEETSIDRLASQLREKNPEMNVTFFEAKSNW